MAEEVKGHDRETSPEHVNGRSPAGHGADSGDAVSIKGWLWKFPSESVNDPERAALDRNGGAHRSVHVLGVPRRLFFVLDDEKLRCLTGSPDDVHPASSAPPVVEIEDTSVSLRAIRRVSPGLDVPSHIQIPSNMREGCDPATATLACSLRPVPAPSHRPRADRHANPRSVCFTLITATRMLFFRAEDLRKARTWRRAVVRAVFRHGAPPPSLLSQQLANEAYRMHVERADKLLRFGADPNARNVFGTTALIGEESGRDTRPLFTTLPACPARRGLPSWERSPDASAA